VRPSGSRSRNKFKDLRRNSLRIGTANLFRHSRELNRGHQGSYSPDQGIPRWPPFHCDVKRVVHVYEVSLYPWHGLSSKGFRSPPPSTKSGSGIPFGRDVGLSLSLAVRRFNPADSRPRTTSRSGSRQCPADGAYQARTRAVSKNAVPCGNRGFGSRSLQQTGHYSASARREAMVARAVSKRLSARECPSTTSCVN